jgi:predicted HD phosphohydrolase
LVNSHVAAKRYCTFPAAMRLHHLFMFLSNRYLTAVNRGYYDSLSSASQKSLGFQGGPFQGDELRAFEQDPLRDEMVSLRLWDDAAKLEGVETTTPRAGTYVDIITAHLSRTGLPSQS